MASESVAHSLEKNSSGKRLDLDGLEGFFQEHPELEELYGKGLSIKQAVFYYGDTRRSLRAKITAGEIPAVRLPESHGRKWRVFPDGVPEQLQELVPKKVRKNKQKLRLELDAAEPTAEATQEREDESQEKAESAINENEANLPCLEIENPKLIGTEHAQEIIDFSPPCLPSDSNESKTNLATLFAEQDQASEEGLPKIENVDETPAAYIQETAIPAQKADESEIQTPPGPESETAPAPEQSKKGSARYNQLLERINSLEKEIAELNYQKNYLEARLTGLEDQVKFINQNQYQSRQFNKMLLIIPAIALIASLLIFRFSGQFPLVN